MELASLGRVTRKTFYFRAQGGVGFNVRMRRLELGYSQEDFAQTAGIERSRYGRIERGEVNLTIQSLFALAEHLEVDPAKLLDDITLDDLRHGKQILPLN
jgi:transcriptional regulator with XRE-family HTH domain